MLLSLLLPMLGNVKDPNISSTAFTVRVINKFGATQFPATFAIVGTDAKVSLAGIYAASRWQHLASQLSIHNVHV